MLFAMNNKPNINEIVNFIRKHEPDRQDLIIGLTNSVEGKWKDKAYYQFVGSINANQEGAEWQIEDSIVLEHETLGTIIIDFLKDKSIGGIEFLNNLD
jgi:hypothetical protein